MEEALRSTPSAQDPAQLVASRAPRDDERRVALLVLCLLALFFGVMPGFGAVALRALIGLIHNGFYNGVFNFRYDANILEGPSPFGDFVILSPIVGGLIVVFLVQRFAPEAKGHGVPEVINSVFYGGGNIRWQVAVIKSLASALSIGSGAAVGREGPIIQIGAALGSAFSQVIRPSRWQKVTLLRRSRRRHRGDIQHPARRRALCARNPAARGFQPDLSSGRRRDRRGDIDRQNPDRAGPGVRDPPPSTGSPFPRWCSSTRRDRRRGFYVATAQLDLIRTPISPFGNPRASQSRAFCKGCEI